MTDEPMVERLTALEAAATPGPWEVVFDYLDARPGIEAPTVGFSVVIYGSPDDPTDEVGVQKMEDAALIVAMRNDLPSLLSQLREQRDRASLAEIERDTAQAQVRAKQSWIDGMKVDYDALNDEAHDHAHSAAIAEAKLAAAERTVREQREALERWVDLADLGWGVIANAGWNGEDKTEGWDEAAVRWRDDYHALRAALAPDTEGEGT